jgi:hypothetical protein
VIAAALKAGQTRDSEARDSARSLWHTATIQQCLMARSLWHTATRPQHLRVQSLLARSLWHTVKRSQCLTPRLLWHTDKLPRCLTPRSVAVAHSHYESAYGTIAAALIHDTTVPDGTIAVARSNEAAEPDGTIAVGTIIIQSAQSEGAKCRVQGAQRKLCAGCTEQECNVRCSHLEHYYTQDCADSRLRNAAAIASTTALKPV